jgi:hypothetical protein
VTRREAVAAPDGGLLQQRERQQRRLSFPFASNQQRQRHDGDRGKAENRRNRGGIKMLGPLQRQDQRRDEQRKQQDAPEVELPAPGGRRQRRQPQCQ